MGTWEDGVKLALEIKAENRERYLGQLVAEHYVAETKLRVEAPCPQGPTLENVKATCKTHDTLKMLSTIRRLSMTAIIAELVELEAQRLEDLVLFDPSI